MKRHWVATLLAVWMFADALLMLLWEAQQLYSVWGFHYRTRMPHSPIWRIVIIDNLFGLLGLLPAPHLLLALPQVFFPRTNSLMRDSLLNIAIFGIAVATGYGLLRMRQWARWSYAAVCVLSIVLSLFFNRPAATLLIAIYNKFIGGIILPVVLLIFLFRRGLAAQSREASSPPSLQ